MTPSDEITALLADLCAGNQDAADALMPSIYVRLRQTANALAQRERDGHTMQASDLVQEACLRLLVPLGNPWKNRSHFFAVAARSMRQVLIDSARARHAQKRPPASARVDLDLVAAMEPAQSDQLLAIDEALTHLEKLSKRQSRVVELRYFAGLTLRETAQVLGVGVTTVKADWDLAKAWLQLELAKAS
jgi:RNA polymerase sigma factor (TIGR02999 family)